MNPKTSSNTSRYMLWGAPNSAFSAKLRSFFFKSGIDFEEHFPIEPRYSREIVPQIGYWVLPVTELGEGALLQDSTESMLYVERLKTAADKSLIPSTPLLQAMAYFLTFVGSDGFLKPGMHYRWSFLEEQRTYLESAFYDWVPSSDTASERRERLAGIMTLFSGYGPALGITAETKTTIEASWTACLDVLNEHFSVCPYLLGGAPSIADCGLMTMLGPHLSRDPVPAYLMRTRAPMVCRWVERMNRPAWFDGGFPEIATSFSEDDEVPASLLPFLRYVATDVAPEVIATIDRFNVWVVDEAALNADRSLDDPTSLGAHPNCGEIRYDLRGQQIRRVGFVDTVYQFQQVLKQVSSMPSEARSAFQTLLRETGLVELFERKPTKSIRYADYRYFLD